MSIQIYRGVIEKLPMCPEETRPRPPVPSIDSFGFMRIPTLHGFDSDDHPMDFAILSITSMRSVSYLILDSIPL